MGFSGQKKLPTGDPVQPGSFMGPTRQVVQPRGAHTGEKTLTAQLSPVYLCCGSQLHEPYVHMCNAGALAASQSVVLVIEPNLSEPHFPRRLWCMCVAL